MKEPTTVERKSDRELVISRIVSGPARLVFEAWTNPRVFERWWVPKSVPMSLLSCEIDARVGGRYRLVFQFGSQTAEFFGKYLEVTPYSRLSWTNDEGGEDVAAITTVTFEERGDKTLVTVHELHPSKEALDDAIASGAAAGMPEQLDQLDALMSSQER